MANPLMLQVTISAWLEFKTITIGEQWKLKALDAVRSRG